MKKFNKYIFTLAALILAFTACVKEEGYEKGAADVEGCYGVYFPAQEATGAHTYDPSQDTEIVFTVARTNSEGKITVPVKYKESHEGIFKLEELVFEDGASESTLKVTFPESANGTEYKLQLSIEDPLYASRYSEGATYVDFSVLRVEWIDFLNPQTNEPALVTFYEGWWGEVHTAKIKYYEVDGVRTCVATCQDVYLNEDGTPYLDESGNPVPVGIWGDLVGVTFNFIWNTNLTNADGYQVIDVQKQYFGFDYADWGSKPESQAANPIYFYDWFHFLTTDGGYPGGWPDWAGFLAKNPGTYDQSYYDGNGGFHFNLRYFIPSLGGGWAPDTFDVVALADGFVRTDYSIELVAGQSVEGQLPVRVNAGADVASIKYAVFEGELFPGQVANKAEEIAAGTVEAATITAAELAENNVLSVSLQTTGVYTLVAVGYDEAGNVQENSSVAFSYVAADDEVRVVLTVGIGSAQKYVPEGVDTDYALEYWMYGSDLEYVKFGIFSSIDLAKDMEACIGTVASSEPVDPETLATINDGGLVSVVDGLNPGTEYYLLAIASNGYATEFFLSEGFYTTGEPHPVYMNFSMADIADELIPANSEGFFGTYNHYAKVADSKMNLSSTREYCGQVVISDSEVADLPADDYGIVTEYVSVKGVFGAAAEYYGFDDTMTMEFYDGVLYQLPSYFGPSTNGNYYMGVMYATADGGLYGHNNSYTMLGGFVQDGYLAFVDATGSYGFNGWLVRAFSDEACASPVGNVDYIADLLFVDPAKDDTGLAPEAPQTTAAQLNKISDALKQGPTNYVETPRGNIRSIIDAAKNTPVLRGQLTTIEGQREAKAVAFKAELSSEKVQTPSRRDAIIKNQNISLR